MNKVIGVHFWEDKAEVCWCAEENIVTGTIEMPSDTRNTSILRVDTSFKRAFDTIFDFLKSNTDMDGFDVVLAVPDFYGMAEISAIYQMALDFDISIVRVITETMALAVDMLCEYGASERIITGFVNGRNLGLAEFDLSRGSVVKTDTYVAGIWNTSSFFKTTFCHSYSERMMDRTEAVGIYYAGSMNDCLQFDQTIKTYVKRSEDFINKEIEIKMMDNSMVIEGLGFICGKVEGLPQFRGIYLSDLLSPFGLTISVGGEMYPVFDEGTKIPADVETELRRIVEPKVSYTEISVYENKNSKYENIKNIRVPKTKLEGLYNKLIQVMVRAGEDKRIEFVFKDIGSDKEIVVPMLSAVGWVEIPDEHVESVEGIIKKLLPIVDSLEYAVKFSKDEDNPYYQGILQSYNKALDILSENEIIPIPGEGTPFDYNLHNAVAQVVDEELPDNTVKQVMQTGYMYKEKVLRPAAVIVANC